MSVMLCMGANFAKKNSCFVAKIVPQYTTGLHLLTLHILEPYLKSQSLYLTLMALL